MNKMSIIRRTSFFSTIAVLGTGCVNIPDMEVDFEGLQHVATEIAFESEYLSTATLARKAPEESPPAYQVGPNDEITVFVMGREDLGSQIPVDTAGAFGRLSASIVQENGQIVLPLLGPVPVAGRSIEEVRTDIEEAYAERIAQSNVDVIMQECRSQPVHVTGAVNLPATYYLCNDRHTLNDVLSAAQWLSPDAFPAGGVLTRGGQTHQLSYPLHDNSQRDLDILLESGDSIHFPTIEEGVLPKVHVFGMVGTQGTFNIPPDGLSVLDALGFAEGFDFEAAQVDDIYLMRFENEDSPVTYKIALDELLQGPSIPVAANDRIYVAPSNLARWDTWWRLAIPFTLSVRTID